MKGMKYEDIIYFPHHVSETHPKMSLHDRAAQFSPFAALTGHGAALAETARRTAERVELEEDSRVILDEKMGLLRQWLSEGIFPVISVTYFVPDEKKSGGKYLTAEGKLKKIKEYEKCLVIESSSEILEEIPVAEIINVTGELFCEWD